jgi:P27 family predicted phage terminase small subunit
MIFGIIQKNNFFLAGLSMLGDSSPLKLKILSGNHRISRLNTGEPLPPPGVPDCPDYLDAVAKEKWTELCQVLGETGLLTQADRDVIAMYCSAFSQWREAADMAKKTGLVIKGASGICANPCVKIAADAKREMRDLSTLLGLDPASRTRLRVSPRARPQDNRRGAAG